ncbi:MAG: universal stress protein [Chloroflexaceae bacterium]|nr:universal stress protein [Chloroflexaceae bacterium]
MGPFSAAPHDDILVLLVQVAVLLCAARLGGEIAQRFGQPSVVGEILAGIILGPSVLGTLVPMLGVWVVPQNEIQGYLLEQVALFGAMFMLLITGLEIDVGLIRRHARAAIGTAAGGLIVPFSTGLGLGFILPDDLLVDPQQRTIFALFIATALSISAIAVIAKVLIDLQMLRRDIGQVIMAAAMIDDITAWTMLSILVGVAAGATLTVLGVLKAVLSVVAFVIVSFTVGRWLVRRVLTFAQDRLKSSEAVLTAVIVLTFGWGAVSQALHLEAVIGAFVIGILFGQIPTMPRDVIHKLESMALGVFAPIFFGVAGLKVNIAGLFEPRLLLFTGLFLAVACIGKITGAYIGARLSGTTDHWKALSLGMALNARGAVEIIIATIGLSLGLLTQDIFSMIVVVAMVTSLMAPSLLRWTLGRTQISTEERERLRREEQLRGNPVSSAHRVLVPIRLRDDADAATVQTVEAQILERIAGGRKLAVTLLCVVPTADRARATTFLDHVAPLFRQQQVTKKIVVDKQPDVAILEEASKSYDLLVMGAPEPGAGSDVLFTPLIDYVVRFASCPAIVVRGQHIATDWTPRRILVPTNGSLAARRAAQLAFTLADNPEASVLVHSVVVPDQLSYSDSADYEQRQFRIAQQVVTDLQTLGTSLGVQVDSEVTIAPDPTFAILEMARTVESDLIVVGTSVRVGSQRLYLGTHVERLLARATCPVMIINAPFIEHEAPHPVATAASTESGLTAPASAV